MEELEYIFDTQLLLEGKNLNPDNIRDHITDTFKGDCLLLVGDEELVKLHFHTNAPGKVVDYMSTLGEVFDVVIENMDRQQRGLKG